MYYAPLFIHVDGSNILSKILVISNKLLQKKSTLFLQFSIN